MSEDEASKNLLSSDPAALSNNELGNRWLATILSALFEAWPAPKTLSVFDLTQDVTKLKYEDEVDERFLALFDGLTFWLRNEGVITFNLSPGSRAVVNAALLTSKGFSAIRKTVPGTLDRSTGDQIKDLADQAGSEAVKAGAKSAGKEIAEFAGAFIGNLAKPFLT